LGVQHLRKYETQRGPGGDYGKKFLWRRKAREREKTFRIGDDSLRATRNQDQN